MGAAPLPFPSVASLRAVLLVCCLAVSAQSASDGAPCASAFQCWRTEPVDANGLPLTLAGVASRPKRLEIGGSGKRGGKCRCMEGTCRLFDVASESFFACEQFSL